MYLKQECERSTNVLTKYYFVTAPSFSFHLPACSTSSWQGMFLIYFHIISHKFVPASLRKPCVILVSEKIVFSPMVFDGNPTHFIPVIFEKSKFVNLRYV